jgi:Uma2 family endonuclease
MAGPARKVATYQDVLDAPAHLRAEVLDGQLYLHSRPARRHARVASTIGASLLNAFEVGIGGPGGWVIIFEPELHLAKDIVVPDIAGWRVETFTGDMASNAAFFTEPPDWACEVISESTARIDRMKKVPIYAREKIQHVWIVEPMAETVELLQLEGAGYRLLGTWGGRDAPLSVPPFEAVAFAVEAFWPRLFLQE